ncbi:hypothetical protein BOTCAL_0292g00050 [Botryotinia calthae]|uniref:Dynamin N-terminal domain-containing protein n=1 Tax=Botryotinia calthae TaxID=38488 RepID=A0A4Y8CVD3_9HELO|nr:hypothetical protein BOTCAL_0292g00050 [Botryotinia calthae]
MADRIMKKEPRSSKSFQSDTMSDSDNEKPAARASTKKPAFSKFVAKKTIGKSLAAISSQKAANSAARPKARWESDLSGLPRVQAVKILEDAAEQGNTFMQAATQILKDHQDNIPAVKHRIDRHAQVYKERRECQIHIGFLGGSGTGKSSVINALLGEEDLLPVSDEVASTAVIVEISYSSSEDPECLYSATIEGVSRSEIQQELEELYEDMAAWNLGVEEEGVEPDTEIMQRMQDTVSKYKCVFAELKTLGDWAKTSVDKLLAISSAQLLMDKKRTITKDNLKAFAAAIKPFIDTSKRKDGGVSHSLWPLVKVVKLFIKAPILKAGIVFVDLPGVHDTSAARNAIARNHMKNLDISCVVAPSVRAGSDKGAHVILNSIRKRDMQFDGLFTADSLFFIVSKIDDSLKLQRYITDHPDLGEELAPDLNHIQVEDDQLKEIEQRLKMLVSKREKGVKNIAKLNGVINQGSSGRVAPRQKRKRDKNTEATLPNDTFSQAQNACQTLQMEVNSYSNQLWSLQTKKEIIESSLANNRARIKAKCIKNRNEIQIAAINEEFEAGTKELGEQEASSPLQIFCVSAKAFLDLCSGQAGEALDCGFFTKADTGIPTLRDALIVKTWETRLLNSRTFNEGVANAAALLDMWSADTIADFKMRLDERAVVETKLNEMYGALEQEFEKLNVDIANAIEKLIGDHLCPQFEIIAENAYKEQEKLVLREWIQKPIAWNTHRAINRRMGVWISARANKDFDWNEQLNNAFLKHLLVLWHETLHKNLPALRKPYDERVDTIIAEFTDLTMSAADEISPSIRDGFENIKDSVLTHRRRLKQAAGVIFNSIDVSAKDIWRIVKTECEETWEDIFRECGDRKGTGTYERNKEAHKAHLKGDGGLAMYHSASVEMQEAFQEACQKLPGQFEESFDDSLRVIKQEFIDVLEQHTVSGTRHNGRRVNSKFKINLRAALEPHFKKLHKAWEAEPEPASRIHDDQIVDEPSDGELSDDIDELLKFGTQEYMDRDGKDSDIEEGYPF